MNRYKAKEIIKISAIMLVATALTMPIAISQEVSVADLIDSSNVTESVTYDFLFNVSDEVMEKVVRLGGIIESELPPPVLFGITPDEVADTWGDARSNGRVHNAVDILAPQGEFVVSPSREAVVTNIGYDSKGGNYVITANPGGEQYYFAHLDKIAENLRVGDVLSLGDFIGYVGNTGNARETDPHLHFAIYSGELARNPKDRIKMELSLEDKLIFLDKILGIADDSFLIAMNFINENSTLIREARANEIELPLVLQKLTDDDEIVNLTTVFNRNLTLESEGEDVRLLQEFLIDNNFGPRSKELGSAGATGYFGHITKRALSEYQDSRNISPSVGYFGPLTKSSILLHKIFIENEVLFMESETDGNSFRIDINQDLEVGSEGRSVSKLQGFLIDRNVGPNSELLASVGTTGYFGHLTRDALSEFQKSMGIMPASGFFGPITRQHINSN